ncbi:MAG: hypothetical protein U5N26_02205 [Candidatus Marinimicrobia bacterium]|nr:hypothetical protein [Candidatus Neomarinimicrobiota bacterium]
MNISEKDNEKITRSTRDTISSYNFDMSKNMNLSYDPFRSMKISYKRSANSDLQNYRYSTWRIFTDLSYDSLMNGVNVGNVTRMTEDLSVNYNPDISKWLKPRLSYGSGYKYSTQNNWDYANVSVRRDISASATVSLKQVWDTYEKKIRDHIEKKRKEKASEEEDDIPPPRKDVQQREDRDDPPAAEHGGRPGSKTEKKPERSRISISDLLGKIDPISVNYSDEFQKSNSGIAGSDTGRIYKDVTYKYRYGFGGTTIFPRNALREYQSTVLQPDFTLPETFQRHQADTLDRAAPGL